MQYAFLRSLGKEVSDKRYEAVASCDY